jgi:predicted RNase H-like HicB family nuclease
MTQPRKKTIIMEQIKVSITWSGDNYCANADGEDLNGVVLVTNKTLEGVKKEFESALQVHIEGCLADEDKLPDWVSSGHYELEYVFEVSALLHSLDGVLTRSAIARVTGINERQLGHYFAGIRNPRPEQRQKIVSGIQQISRELASVV